MEDFHPLINRGSWHLKSDTAETAVDAFCLKCTIIGEKEKKKMSITLLMKLCFFSVNCWVAVLVLSCPGIACANTIQYSLCQLIID